MSHRAFSGRFMVCTIEMGGGVGVSEPENASVHERWANLRFAVVGQLLAAPPEKGMLRRELMALAARTWRHPVTGAPVRFGLSTIERWYAAARRERRDPVGVLRRKVRKDLGVQSSVKAALQRAIREQYDLHPSWSVYLHYSNLKALAEKPAEIAPVPAYSTIRRFFEAQGLRKRRRLSSWRTEGAECAEQRLLDREVRSYEAEHVNPLYGLPLRCKSDFASGFKIGLRTIYPASGCLRRGGP
jgi:putative transposase